MKEIKQTISKETLKRRVEHFQQLRALLTEENPITAIVVPQRQYKAVENMVLASVHAPLTVSGIGTIRFEDTYVVRPEKSDRLTKFDYKIFK